MRKKVIGFALGAPATTTLWAKRKFFVIKVICGVPAITTFIAIR